MESGGGRRDEKKPVKINRLKGGTILPTETLGVEIFHYKLSRYINALIMRFLCYDLHINFFKIGYLFPN